MIRALVGYWGKLALAWLALRWLSMSDWQKRELVADLIASLALGLIGLVLMIIRIAMLP